VRLDCESVHPSTRAGRLQVGRKRLASCDLGVTPKEFELPKTGETPRTGRVDAENVVHGPALTLLFPNLASLETKVTFLAGPGASFITGQALTVGGDSRLADVAR